MFSNNTQNNEDRTKPIFEDLYECRYNRFLAMSTEELRNTPVYSSGNAAVDRELSKELTLTYMPIAKMAVYIDKGIPVYLTKLTDTPKIYEVVQKYLSFQYNLITSSRLNGTSTELLDDLIKLDKFATIIYERAKYLFDPSKTESFFARHMSSSGFFDKEAFLEKSKKLSQPKSDKVEEKEQPPERFSMADAFIKKSVGTKVWK